MDKQPNNKYLSVSYQLYSIEDDGSKHLVEQTIQGRPFTFISGFGFTLDGFEQRIVPLQPGEKFDFTLAPAEAFGEYFEEGILKLGREQFLIDGQFDHERIVPGAVIPLKNQDEQQVLARVVRVEADEVTLDANHPLAGQTLQFTGIVLENRDATNKEIEDLLTRMSHECSGDCDDCGSDGCGGHCGGCGQ